MTRWQAGKPTESGWYWVKGSDVYIVRVYRGSETDRLLYDFGPFSDIQNEVDKSLGYVTHFSGPIPLPDSCHDDCQATVQKL